MQCSHFSRQRRENTNYTAINIRTLISSFLENGERDELTDRNTCSKLSLNRDEYLANNDLRSGQCYMGVVRLIQNHSNLCRFLS